MTSTKLSEVLDEKDFGSNSNNRISSAIPGKKNEPDEDLEEDDLEDEDLDDDDQEDDDFEEEEFKERLDTEFPLSGGETDEDL